MTSTRAAIAVHALEREPWPCRDGAGVGRFLVALRSGGVDRRRSGDRRTPRGKAEPEWPTTAFDWMKGCVATGTDADVEVIATFVRERQPVVAIR